MQSERGNVAGAFTEVLEEGGALVVRGELQRSRERDVQGRRGAEAAVVQGLESGIGQLRGQQLVGAGHEARQARALARAGPPFQVHERSPGRGTRAAAEHLYGRR